MQCMAEAEQLGLQCYWESSGGVSATAALAGGGDTADGSLEDEEGALDDFDEDNMQD